MLLEGSIWAGWEFRAGGYASRREGILTDEYLWKAVRLRGDDNFDCQVFVTAGYISQVESLFQFLNHADSFLTRFCQGSKYVDIATINSIQGKERRLVIVFLTRSNLERWLGFTLLDCHKGQFYDDFKWYGSSALAFLVFGDDGARLVTPMTPKRLLDMHEFREYEQR